MFAHQCFKTAPPFQSEEYLAFQMESDPSTASLLQFSTTLLTVVEFCEDILVLHINESSYAKLKWDVKTLKPLPWMVLVSSLYLVAASMLAGVSQGTFVSGSFRNFCNIYK